MNIKSYFARSVEDAMAQAALELGTEAMLVNSRKSPPEARHRGEYEVVFASDVPPKAIAASGGAGERATEAPYPRNDHLSKEIGELKRELERMRRAFTRSVVPAQLAGAPPDLSEAYAMLAAQEISPDLSREIVVCSSARLASLRQRPQDRGRAANVRAVLMEEMGARFSAEPGCGRGESRPAIVALVGPPGAGKTTTLVKLAVHYGLAARRPVLLITMDTYRIAASEQLRSLAAILGVGFLVHETVGAVSQAIEENRGKELIFIDTPGLGFRDLDGAQELAGFLANRNDIDTHLVLSSSMKSADLSRVVDSFEIFHPRRLLFTRLDETASCGPIFVEAARTGKPLSYFGTGQRIPEDLEEASRERLLELILAGREGWAASAA